MLKTSSDARDNFSLPQFSVHCGNRYLAYQREHEEQWERKAYLEETLKLYPNIEYLSTSRNKINKPLQNVHGF
jgi:hypothetical protein